MSTKLSSATALHEVRLASTKSGLGVSKGGPSETLGSTVIANAESGSDRILYYVNSTGDAIAASGPLYQPKSGDVAVKVLAGTGDQTWVYVQAANANIGIGAVVVLAADGTYGPYDVAAATGGVTAAAAATAASKLAGVAQHNIPAQSFGWILVKGVGIAATNAAVVAGDELTLGGGAGELTTLAAGKGVGLALAAGGGVTSVKLDI